MAKYEVTVYTDTTFTVEADTPEEAKDKAVDLAESHHGMYFDWQCEDEDIELAVDEPEVSW